MKYITIADESQEVMNPYYTPACRNIESEYVDDTKTTVTYHKSQEDFVEYLKKADRVRRVNM